MDHVLDRSDVEELVSHLLVCYLLLFDLVHVYAEDFSDGFVMKSLEFVHVLLRGSPGLAPPENDVDGDGDVD